MKVGYNNCFDFFEIGITAKFLCLKENEHLITKMVRNDCGETINQVIYNGEIAYTSNNNLFVAGRSEYHKL